jgi:hypothetical protein
MRKRTQTIAEFDLSHLEAEAVRRELQESGESLEEFMATAVQNFLAEPNL